jgi:hypothetical protein
MKKQITQFFLFLACFLQLGHSLSPHIHVQEHNNNGSLHHHHDSSEDGLALFLSHFTHISEVFSTNQLEQVAKLVTDTANTIVVVNSNSYYSNFLPLSSKRALHFYEEPFVTISPHLHCLQFRGPPSFIVV